MSQPAKGALSQAELTEALTQHPGWEVRGKAIARGFQCKDFLAAIALVNEIAAVAQRLDHHPDILVQFDKLTFTLSSHDAGGVTQRDLKLAGEIDAVAAKSGARPLDKI